MKTIKQYWQASAQGKFDGNLDGYCFKNSCMLDFFGGKNVSMKEAEFSYGIEVRPSIGESSRKELALDVSMAKTPRLKFRFGSLDFSLITEGTKICQTVEKDNGPVFLGFEETQIVSDIFISGCNIGGSVWFHKCSTNGRIHFEDCKISGDVYFDDCIIAHRPTFSGCSIGGDFEIYENCKTNSQPRFSQRSLF